MRMGKGRIAVGAFVLTFGAIMVYSFVVNVPEARATRPDTGLVPGNVYFLYEDHIGRPVLMTEYQDQETPNGYEFDADANRYWKASYKPFGQVQDSFSSTGITVGTGDNAITWTPPFRFPGQYEDPEMDAHFDIYYNWHRFYVPGLGRYSSTDQLKNLFNNYYDYSNNNPVSNFDENGLAFGCTSPKCYPLSNNEKLKLQDAADKVSGWSGFGCGLTGWDGYVFESCDMGAGGHADPKTLTIQINSKYFYYSNPIYLGCVLSHEMCHKANKNECEAYENTIDCFEHFQEYAPIKTVCEEKCGCNVKSEEKCSWCTKKCSNYINMGG